MTPHYFERLKAMKTLRMLCALAGIFFMSIATGRATTVLPMNLKDLTVNAELIFGGTVSDIRSEKQGNTIYTYVTFSNLQFVKGTHVGPTIEVRLSGGSVADETIEVVGMPNFVLGERNLIFLAGNHRYLCPIVGWEQGRFKIRWDGVSRREVVFDGANDPVTEISGNQIVKGRKARLARGFPGVPDSGPAASVDVQQQREEKRALSLGEFVSAVEKIMGKRQ